MLQTEFPVIFIPGMQSPMCLRNRVSEELSGDIIAEFRKAELHSYEAVRLKGNTGWEGFHPANTCEVL